VPIVYEKKEICTRDGRQGGISNYRDHLMYSAAALVVVVFSEGSNVTNIKMGSQLCWE
jgi:hypothetical protein